MNRENLSQSLFREIEEALLVNTVKFPFPWESLAQYAESFPEKTIPIVGYGSLISEVSAAQTIKEVGTKRTPCMAYGCRRVFNYRMPKAVAERYEVDSDSAERAALNVEVTGNASDVINGILIGLNCSDIPALLSREFGYDLKPVACLPWENFQNAKPSLAYVLSAPDVAAKPEWQVVDKAVLPEPAYAKICADGARSHSPEFLDFYYRTTFLADKVTSLEQ